MSSSDISVALDSPREGAEAPLRLDDLLAVIARLTAVCREWHNANHDGVYENCKAFRCKRAKGDT